MCGSGGTRKPLMSACQIHRTLDRSTNRPSDARPLDRANAAFGRINGANAAFAHPAAVNRSALQR